MEEGKNRKSNGSKMVGRTPSSSPILENKNGGEEDSDWTVCGQNGEDEDPPPVPPFSRTKWRRERLGEEKMREEDWGSAGSVWVVAGQDDVQVVQERHCLRERKFGPLDLVGSSRDRIVGRTAEVRSDQVRVEEAAH
jgi:hypothetical protein